MKRNSNNARKKRIQSRKRNEKVRIDRLHHFEIAKSYIQPENDKLNLFINIGHVLFNAAQNCGLPEDEFQADILSLMMELGITFDMLEKDYTKVFGVPPPVILSSMSLSPIGNEAEKSEVVPELCGVENVFFA